MRVIVVGDQDEVLGFKDKKDRNPADIIRVSGLWIYNSDNQVLIAQRSLNKVHDAGKWGPSVAGTVEEGETYLSNILKEAQEELGLELQEEDLKVGAHRFAEASHKYFCQVYFIKQDLPADSFKLQTDEVEQVKWISIEELNQWIINSPDDFISSFKDTLQDYLNFFSL